MAARKNKYINDSASIEALRVIFLIYYVTGVLKSENIDVQCPCRGPESKKRRRNCERLRLLRCFLSDDVVS
jgi:hypothetical protein